MSLMDIDQIKAEAPDDAAFWSPAVEHYFDFRYMNLFFKGQGKLIQVEPQFRSELVPLTK
ncbi:hypothetical protein VII00023_07254 [Vibrio ichthyoenteri ATCC 700023]|uniref:Uncharacterized protein n=1 Tax=Vibrio ichthyoenteri ATCC 700023 TaxID=870968 RepID=F9S2W2_9VIBR|nr:hypothetical protein [Vibrio ichthyoenteri]EGU38836.1 hypothetical protein VII00023_07254 [Vibrio ichthyoenteri ATCC 700023]